MNKFIALIVMILCSPLFLLILIILYKNRPIFFFQNRIGKDLKIFKIIKFRTMLYNEFSDIQLNDGDNLKEKRELYKTTETGDSRVTKFGIILRKYHLDELPQLINIFKGDMNLIGPRPDVPVQKFDYTEKDWRIRNSVKPGITGLSQISEYKSEKERQALDVYYVKNKNFWMNLKICIMTIIKIAKGNSL
ncbi:MAG: sugar transferase [Flavobacteriaceae bacterium]|nr:sugar transferase [Flavobacteriaceae bacterium]